MFLIDIVEDIATLMLLALLLPLLPPLWVIRKGAPWARRMLS